MRDHESHNANHFVLANGSQGIGDQLVSGKTVLPWLFFAAGVPTFMTAFLVPIREAGSMLPQAAITPWVQSQSQRKKIFVLGSVGQFLAAALMALAAFTLKGWALGFSVLILLAILATSRSLTSLAGKDILGATVSKGKRGAITGRATAVSGLVALVVGIALAQYQEGLPAWVLAILIGLGAAGWAVTAWLGTTFHEPPRESTRTQGPNTWLSDTLGLFRTDRDFRSFVIVRSLLLVSSLSTAFVVVLSQDIGHSFRGLGLFIVASAIASLVGGPLSGRLADLSSRLLMAAGAALASLAIVAIVLIAYLWPDTIAPFALPIGYFIIHLAHTAVRVGRKTYIVDMAEGDQRTQYTGAANTMMGIMLLIMGAISAAVSLAGAHMALLFLAAVGIAGVIGSLKMKEVSGA